MIFKDYYKILGLETNKVTANQIKTAYREQAKKYHPDVNAQNNEERFKDINEAYMVLSDSSAKRKYDRVWQKNFSRNNSLYRDGKKSKKTLFSDLSKMFLGDLKIEKNIDSSKINGKNIETEISITLKEAFEGTVKKIGFKDANNKVKKVTINIPAGISNNEILKIDGMGKPGKSNGKPGDLFLKIKINDEPGIKLKGIDLYKDLYITPYEAALGSKIIIDGINEKINLYIPSGTSSGEIFKINNKGFVNKENKRGILFLNTQIMISKKIPEEEIKIYKELKSTSNFNPRSMK